MKFMRIRGCLAAFLEWLDTPAEAPDDWQDTVAW